MSDLKPCPFCGGEAECVDAVEAGEGAKVICCRGCMSSSKVIFALMDDVSFDLQCAWNNRAPDPETAALRAENERLREALVPFAVECERLDDRDCYGPDVVMDDVEIWQAGSRKARDIKITYGNLRRARAALSPTDGEGV